MSLNPAPRLSIRIDYRPDALAMQWTRINVQLADDMPRTATGKVLHRVLRPGFVTLDRVHPWDAGLKDSHMIVVRLATLDDADVIALQTSSVQQLHNEALPFIFKPPSADLLPAQKLAALIEDPNSIVAVAEIGGRVVGHIYGAVVTRAENEFNRAGSCLYIYQIGIDDDARRRGAGTALITFMRDLARALGLTALQLDHWAFNARARDFFEACGFLPMKITMRQTLQG